MPRARCRASKPRADRGQPARSGRQHQPRGAEPGPVAPGAVPAHGAIQSAAPSAAERPGSRAWKPRGEAGGAALGWSVAAAAARSGLRACSHGSVWRGAGGGRRDHPCRCGWRRASCGRSGRCCALCPARWRAIAKAISACRWSADRDDELGELLSAHNELAAHCARNARTWYSASCCSTR